MHRDESPSTAAIVNGAKSREHTELRKPLDDEPWDLVVLTTDLYFADPEGLQMKARSLYHLRIPWHTGNTPSSASPQRGETVSN